MTPGKLSNVLSRAFFNLLILPASKSVLDTAFSWLTSDISASSAWHIDIRGFTLEVSEDAVSLLPLSFVVQLPDDYVVIAPRRYQSIVRTESQSINTPITEIINTIHNYLLFRMGVMVQLMDAFPGLPAPNPDEPVVATCS